MKQFFQPSIAVINLQAQKMQLWQILSFLSNICIVCYTGHHSAMSWQSATSFRRPQFVVWGGPIAGSCWHCEMNTRSWWTNALDGAASLQFLFSLWIMVWMLYKTQVFALSWKYIWAKQFFTDSTGPLIVQSNLDIWFEWGNNIWLQSNLYSKVLGTFKIHRYTGHFVLRSITKMLINWSVNIKNPLYR